MQNNHFLIEDKNIHNISGDVIGVAKSVFLTVLPYQLFSPTVTIYAEFRDENNLMILPGFNKTFPTPEDWGTDDSVVVEAALATLGVTSLGPVPMPTPIPPAPPVEETTQNPE